MGAYLKGIVALIIILFLITFGVKNSQPVRVDYYFDFLDIQIPLYGLIFLSMVVGILIGMLVGLQSRLRLKRDVRTLKREIRALDDKKEEVPPSDGWTTPIREEKEK
jgi:uncharacterized integral membrane protein